MAKCLNGGACVNGKCICTKTFGGDFCEEDLTSDSSWVWWVLIFLLLAAAGIGGYLLFKKNEDTWTKPSDDNKNNVPFVDDEPKPIQVS